MRSQISIVLATLVLNQIQQNWSHPIGIGATACPDNKILDSMGNCVERIEIIIVEEIWNPFEKVEVIEEIEVIKETTTVIPKVESSKVMTKTPTSSLRNKVHQLFADAIVKLFLRFNKS